MAENIELCIFSNTMRVYTTVRPCLHAHMSADAFSDAVVVLTPPAGEYIRASSVFWSWDSDPEPSFLQIKDLTDNTVHIFAWIKNLQGVPRITSYDILDFGSEAHCFLVDHIIEFRLSGTAAKWLTVSYT